MNRSYWVIGSITAILIAIVFGIANAAVTITESQPKHYGPMTVFELLVTMSSIGTSPPTTHEINGIIDSVEVNPGSTAPTDNYYIKILDDAGLDVMGGSMSDCDTSNTEKYRPYVNGVEHSAPTTGYHTINITENTQDGATAVLKIYVYDFMGN